MDVAVGVRGALSNLTRGTVLKASLCAQAKDKEIAKLTSEIRCLQAELTSRNGMALLKMNPDG